MNLKVGGTGPERKWGHQSGTKCQKIFFGRAPPPFGSKSTISRFGERFFDGQHSLVSFLFAVLLLTVPPTFKFIPAPLVGHHALCEDYRNVYRTRVIRQF